MITPSFRWIESTGLRVVLEVGHMPTTSESQGKEDPACFKWEYPQTRISHANTIRALSLVGSILSLVLMVLVPSIPPVAGSLPEAVPICAFGEILTKATPLPKYAAEYVIEEVPGPTIVANKFGKWGLKLQKQGLGFKTLRISDNAGNILGKVEINITRVYTYVAIECDTQTQPMKCKAVEQPE